MSDNGFDELDPAEDHGSNTIHRFRYQDLCVVPLCVQALHPDTAIESIYPEYVEDIAVEETDRWRFIQVKTRSQDQPKWSLNNLLASGALASLWRAFLEASVDAERAGKQLELGAWLSGSIRQSKRGQPEPLHILVAHGENGYLVDRSRWIDRIQQIYDCSAAEAEQRIVDLRDRLTPKLTVTVDGVEVNPTSDQVQALIERTWVDEHPPIAAMESSVRDGLLEYAPDGFTKGDLDSTFDGLMAAISVAASAADGRSYASELYSLATGRDQPGDELRRITQAKQLTREEIRELLRPLTNADAEPNGDGDMEPGTVPPPEPVSSAVGGGPPPGAPDGNGRSAEEHKSDTQLRKFLGWALAAIASVIVGQLVGLTLDRPFWVRMAAAGLLLLAALWAVGKVHEIGDLLSWHSAGIGVLALAAGAVLWRAPGVAAGPPEVVIMDSTVANQVYNEARQESRGSNADDITNILNAVRPRLSLDKETTSLDWAREDEILADNPDLIIIHSSAFYEETDVGDGARKFGSFLKYMTPADTKFLIYTRAATCSDGLEDRYLEEYPFLDKKLDVMCMADNPVWDAVTGRELKDRVRTLLDLGDASST